MKLISRRKTCRLCYTTIPIFLAGIVSTTLLRRDSHLPNSLNTALNITTEIAKESGDFLQEIERLKKLAIAKESNLYQAPTAEQLNQFKTLAKALIAKDISTAKIQAEQLNYELVEFVNNSTQQVFYGLREKPKPEGSQRGWGAYFFNSDSQTKGMVEVPHLLADRHTELIGAQAFVLAKARAFLLAGAHRHANGINTADVCDPISSVFQTVHEAGVDAGLKTWQIHGFLRRANFPPHARAVLSDGRGNISSEIKDLARRLHQSGVEAYVYNHSPPSSPENRQVNGEFSGRMFAELGGTQNLQGIYSHSRQVAFTHIELSKWVRSQPIYRDRAARAIADSIQAIG